MAKTCNQIIETPTEIPAGSFPYAVLYEAVLGAGDMCPDCNTRHVGDKEAGQRLGVSERQIRNARFSGVVDEFVADVMCCKGLGLHPSAVFVDGEWDGLGYDFDRQEAIADAADAKRARKAGVA